MRMTRKMTALLLTLMLLTGCAAEPRQPERSEDTALKLLEEAPVLEYDVPVMTVGVLVNQIGYDADSPKTVVVRGRKLPEEFRVVNASDGETVFTGELEKAEYDEVKGEYNSYGDFTSFAQEGTYYIECDYIGCSYDFEIREGLYEELSDRALELLRKKRETVKAADVVDICRCLSVLLLSYELYPQVYGADGEEVPPLMAEIRGYVEELLLLQDEKSGAVREGETEYRPETVWVSAVLAKFSYSYQKYDSTYATVCLQAADRAWRFLEKQGEETEPELRFFAAAELYRATGQNRYYNAANRLGEALASNPGSRTLLLGVLTYSSTKRKVNMELCAELMAGVFDEAEQIAVNAQTDAYLIGGGTDGTGLENIFWDALVLSVIDYIITNQEYATLIARHYDYLAGTNETASCYIPDAGGERELFEGVTASRFNLAGYIMLLTEMMSHESRDN